jgi:predicted transposase/invertase (TIGR01784 family)
MANKQAKNLTKFSFAEKSGKIIYNMTNDYMFRAVLQKNEKVLRGLIGAILGIDPNKITVKIANPVVLGENIDNKDFILDIKVLVNEQLRLNLEMQVLLKPFWNDRSLSYLCRTFNEDLEKGDTYEIAPAIQVCFIDFSLHRNCPEFFATYMLQNVKNNKIYSDNFKLHVVELNQTHLATDEDKTHELDKWAALFKVQTWEELKAMAETNEYIAEAAQTMYVLSSDKQIIEQCRRRKEVEQEHNFYISTIAKQNAQLADKDNQLADMGNQIIKKDNQLADMGNQISNMGNQLAEKDALIAELKAQLAQK